MPAGRPSSYDPAICAKVRAYAAGGAIDREIADALDIALSTLYRWKAEFPEFRDALKRGKTIADDMVENALFRRATGYDHDAVKIISVPLGGNMGSEVQHVPYVEHVIPDVTAAIFWLKNRRPNEWRDVSTVKTETESEEQLAERIANLDREIAAARGAGGAS